MSKKARGSAIPRSLPNGDPDWSRMRGKSHGRRPTRLELAQEARTSYASFMPQARRPRAKKQKN